MITFRALRALYWLYEHQNRSVEALPADVVPPEDARAVYDELVTQGALEDTATMGGGFDFYLTPVGRVQARNARDTYRHELALRRVLEWMSTTDSDLARLELSAAADDFSGRLSHREIRDATHYLVDRGLCTSGGSTRADGEYFHVEITPTGRAAARRPQLIDQDSGPNGPITNVSADNYGTMTVGNHVIGGQGHTMTANVTQGASIDEVLKAIGQLRDEIEAAPGISDEDRGELIEEVDNLLAKGAKWGLSWMKAALAALGTQVATTGGQELANQVLQIGSLIN
ncbi:hypothetical protein ACWELJ_21320 [Nocardia sp. NPDC004582]